MSLTPPPKVRKLQDALHSKAKDAPGYRFYALYDKLYREDILRFAYDRCKANGGAPGVDGQSFEDIEAQGLERVAGRIDGRTAEGDVSAPAGPPGEHPQRGSTGQVSAAGDSLASRIAWSRWRLSWCWSRSSRRTCNPNSTRIAPSTAPWTP